MNCFGVCPVSFGGHLGAWHLRIAAFIGRASSPTSPSGKARDGQLLPAVGIRNSCSVRTDGRHFGDSRALSEPQSGPSLCSRHEELDREAREKDTVLAAVKGAHAEQLRALEARVLQLQAHCDTLEGQVHRAECTRAGDAKEKNALIDK